MSASAVVWALRGLATLYALALLISWFRTLRVNRAAQFKARPSTAQGLAGRYTPPVSLIVPSSDGSVGPWIARLSYPRLEVIVAVPEGRSLRGDMPGARVVHAPTADRGALLEAATKAATGEIVAFLPPDLAVGRGFLKRLVAALVDPFVGASVARVVQSRPGAGIASRVDDLDRLARSGVQLGRHVLGAVVTCDREPFAARRQQVEDVGGWNPSMPSPELDLVMRLYVRGFVIAYIEDAVALAPPPRWNGLSAHVQERTAGMRRLWRRARPVLRRSKVLEGPEKTDVRWITRGSSIPLWLLAGWVLTGALRLADTSWVPEAIGSALVLVTFSTLGGTPFFNLSATAVQSRRRTVLALEPWLGPLGLGNLWTGSGAAVASPFRRGARAARGAIVAPAEMLPRRPAAQPEAPEPYVELAEEDLFQDPQDTGVDWLEEPEPVLDEVSAQRPAEEEAEEEIEEAGEPAWEPVEAPIEEAIVEEAIVEEPIVEEPIVEEPIVEERDEPEIAIEQPPQRKARKREKKARTPDGPPIWESR